MRNPQIISIYAQNTLKLWTRENENSAQQHTSYSKTRDYASENLIILLLSALYGFSPTLNDWKRICAAKKRWMTFC
jgi:hypothetical protein